MGSALSLLMGASLLPLQLFYKNGQPFPAHRPVGLRVHISHVELAVEIPVTQEVLQEPNSNVVKVAFTVRKAGRYEITVKLGGLNVAYSPYYKIFQPGMFFVLSFSFSLTPYSLCPFFPFVSFPFFFGRLWWELSILSMLSTTELYSV
jgi:hypothetical protein